MLNFDCKGYKNCNSETLKLCLVSKKKLRENTRAKEVKRKSNKKKKVKENK